MPEATTNEPSKDFSPLSSNRAIATTVLDVLGYGSLATFGIDEHINLAQKIPINLSAGLLKSKASQMVRIPDGAEARRILTTAWTGLTSIQGETMGAAGEILDFRVVDPGAVITRSMGVEKRDNKPGRTSYRSNTQATELLIRRVIRGLGFVDENQDLDRLIRGLRKKGTLTLIHNGISITVTKPEIYRPEVESVLDAAYRIRVQRASIPPREG